MKTAVSSIVSSIIGLLLAALALLLLQQELWRDGPADSADDAILEAIHGEHSDVQVAGSGVVTRVLPDDNHGSRHQRFILTLDSGDTLLIAHNIDLAPRIDGLARGDRVAFYGEYEWNERGGVVHWTHHDPAGRHVGGWLEHNGRRYE